MEAQATWVGSVGTVAALFTAVAVAIYQLRVQRRQAAVERTVDAHKSITTGEAWGARDRLSEYMWRAGSGSDRNRCRQPRFPELVGEGWESLAGGQDLSKYPQDLQISFEQTPFRDLYIIFWNFERVARAYQHNLLDRPLAVAMLASHAIWWDKFSEFIYGEEMRYRLPLHEIASEFLAHAPELEAWAKRDFA